MSAVVKLQSETYLLLSNSKVKHICCCQTPEQNIHTWVWIIVISSQLGSATPEWNMVLWRILIVFKQGWFQLCHNPSNCSYGRGCACVVSTLPWPLFNLALTLPWPSLDIAFTLPWPWFYLALIFPSLDHALTFPWFCLPWPCPYLVLILTWPCLDHAWTQKLGSKKFDQNRISNSWDIADVDKCWQMSPSTILHVAVRIFPVPPGF